MKREALTACVAILMTTGTWNQPASGRFISSDPVGLTGGLNTYAYVNDSPLNYIDPMGLAASVCVRPLNPRVLGSVLMTMNSNWYHEFLCSQTANQSNPLCKGLAPDPHKPSKLQDETTGGICKSIPDPDDCIAKCIQSEWQKPLPEYTEFTGNGVNCQEYSNNLLSGCMQRCVSGGIILK
jgi:uncharacterized protein RhaS with RHS repeats